MKSSLQGYMEGETQGLGSRAWRLGVPPLASETALIPRPCPGSTDILPRTGSPFSTLHPISQSQRGPESVVQLRTARKRLAQPTSWAMAPATFHAMPPNCFPRIPLPPGNWEREMEAQTSGSGVQLLRVRSLDSLDSVISASACPLSLRGFLCKRQGIDP